jgi:DNA-binding beta-propeller fold protein YncE
MVLLILNGNAIKGKFALNYHVPYWGILILLVVSITLVFSSLLYLLPLAYSQEFYHVSSWVEFGIEETDLSLPSGIAVDSSSGNVYVADTANNRIQVFSNDGTYISEWGRYGRSEVEMKLPTDIVIDPSSDQMLVTDTGNSRILVFHSYSPISDEAFPREEEGISSNDDAGNQTAFSGFL